MDRMACVDVPGLPLQLLRRRHPEWKHFPVLVADRDLGQGIVLWADERARSLRIHPGMRVAVARSLGAGVRVGEVPASEIAEAVARLLELAHRLTPDVEPFVEDPGVFWLSGRGLSRHSPSWESWAACARALFVEAGFSANVAVGFTRFGTYAAATSSESVLVFPDPSSERKRTRETPIARLRLDASTREALERLGVHTLGAFIDLPGPSVLRRFGSHVHRLFRLAKGDLWTPIQPAPHVRVFRESRRLEDVELERERLLGLFDHHLRALLLALRSCNRELATLIVELDLEDGTRVQERLRPAEPTLDPRELGKLLEVWLERLDLHAGVIEVVLEGEPAISFAPQVSMLDENPRRDVKALDRSLARLRAHFGDRAVVTATVCDGHLPESTYRWEVFRRTLAASPRPASPRLIRRILSAPRTLPVRPRQEPDGWLVSGIEEGAVEEMAGPYVFSGEWWLGRVERLYHYVRTARKRWLWVFEDRERRAWFQHGEVE